MHSALSFASVLFAASAALAAPMSSNGTSADTSVRVVLQSQATETGSGTVFDSVDSRQYKAPVGSSGPFETLEVVVGAGANQDLRCQALDLEGNAIIATRGDNVDITFSDGGADKFEWTFKQPSEVSRIVCDPAFVAVTPDAFEVSVTLSNSEGPLPPIVFDNVEDRAEESPLSGSTPADTVEISVGELVDPALRCQLLNRRGKPVVAVRGANTDTTFSDADKGEWTFKREQVVSQVICDPAFVARPQ